jgi:hypothetical protein
MGNFCSQECEKPRRSGADMSSELSVEGRVKVGDRAPDFSLPN